MTPGSPGFVAAIVTAQVLTQIGAFSLPALLPHYFDAWSLTPSEAGWLIGVFFAAYVPAVPLLAALTDRVPARQVYLLGTGLTALAHLGFGLLADGFWGGMACRALAGLGWAGAYMPGLKALADPLAGAAQSRAVSWHAAGIGIAGASSFVIAGALNAAFGPTSAFVFGGLAAACAFGIALLVMPATPPQPGPRRNLLDYRPVLRNRRAMAWIAGYTVHTWELAALRAWGVVFLAAALAQPGSPAWLPGPTVLFTAAGLAGVAISITGNETAQKYGRNRVVHAAILSAATLSLLTGWAVALWAPLAVAGVVVWNACIYLDSAALTAGTVQAAEAEHRGATMGLHSMAGYAGGCIGPIGVGLALECWGQGALGWGLGFGHLALVTLAGLWLVRRLGRA